MELREKDTGYCPVLTLNTRVRVKESEPQLAFNSVMPSCGASVKPHAFFVSHFPICKGY